MGLIIDKIIIPDFSDLNYLFDFISELAVALTFLIGTIVIFYLRRKNPLFEKVGGSRLLLGFVLLFVEATMNFIDGNLIWFNEVDPLFIFPAYQLWRLMRFFLAIFGFSALVLGFKAILEKAGTIFGILTE